MVEVRPFRGLFYDPVKVGGLEKVVTLPYDIMSEGKRDRYYESSKFNYARVILGKELPGDNDGENKYARAAGYIREWIRDGVLVEDEKPGFYVYEQEYDVDGKRRRQVGFIGLVKLEPFEKGVVLPHEQIYEKPMLDRYNLLKATRASLETIIGIYSDPEHEADKVFKAVVDSKPRIDLMHDDGVRNRLWPVYDKQVVDRLSGIMRERKVIIADGHHRYTTALKYYTESKDSSMAYIMMLLYSMDDELTIMPTHRVLKGFKDRPEEVLRKLGEYFRVSEFPYGGGNKEDKLKELFGALDGKRSKHAFGAYLGDGKFYLLVLRSNEMIDEFVDGTKSKQWNELDVTILHSLVIEYLMGVKRDDMENIKYVKDKAKAVELVDGGECGIAFFLNPTKLSEVKAIAEAGEKMPQKSSYFYPKPLSGLVACRF
ncbi:MAG: DUF1015 domain-containing protein [Candidatus Altiarchaeota archaeon]|nr:DUF1015 domain-containing protein [Candidatus Altiarchaeota archaeon]